VLEVPGVDVGRDLAGQHESLVGGQLVGDLPQASHVLLAREPPGHIGARIRDHSHARAIRPIVLVVAVVQRRFGCAKSPDNDLPPDGPTPPA
jgi:hypothetical protein